jgi:hypothetical protein
MTPERAARHCCARQELLVRELRPEQPSLHRAATTLRMGVAGNSRGLDSIGLPRCRRTVYLLSSQGMRPDLRTPSTQYRLPLFRY